MQHISRWPFKQLIQIKQDNERGFLDPLIQARRQQKELTKWRVKIDGAGDIFNFEDKNEV